ncbi:MAG: hypothetical protein JOY81_03195 [Alphaproteobacteria bacterium]|nr:hypothetical protein [Alphaproteobacteria bacterium]
MKILFAAAALATTFAAGSALAQTADFKCPAKGTTFVMRSDGVDETSVATGQQGDACTSDRQEGGKTVTVRNYWGVVGSVDAAGESYVKGLNLKALWPLKVGNKIDQTINATGYDGKPYTANVTIAVTAYEKVTVPAGTFDAFRIEESEAGRPTPGIRWWAPALGMSVKNSFPDWKDKTRLKVYELVSIKP